MYITVPASAQNKYSNFIVSVTYYWNGSPNQENTVKVYSKHKKVYLKDSKSTTIMYHMDG